jgi:drug/metabolite transporter (DMT)-like permease
VSATLRGTRSATRILASAVVLFNVSGNLMLRRGLSDEGPVLSLSPVDYIRTFANAWIAGGIILLIAWLLSQLSLLSWADLSYVLPVTSASYILTTLMGALVLHEKVTLTHWIAVVMIFAGVVIVGETPPRTGPAAPDAAQEPAFIEDPEEGA